METNKNNAMAKIGKLFSYGLGEVGCQMSWYMINTYLSVFYTDVLTLSGAAVTLIMVIARIWDAVNDPMMGTICDRTKTKWGKFRPYLYFAPPFLAVFNVLTFTAFPLTGWVKVLVCFVCYVLAGMAYTACSIAYQALQNVSAIESKERMDLASARGIGGAAIGMILSKVVPWALLFFSISVGDPQNPQPDAHGYLIFTIIISVAMIPIFWLCAAGVKETYADQLHNNAKTTEKIGFVKGIKEVVKNDQLLRVVLCTVLGTICVSGRMPLLVYFIKDVVVPGNFAAIGTVFLVMTIAQFVGTLAMPVMTRLFTKKQVLVGLQVIMNVGFLGMFFFASKGLTPTLVLSAICGFCNAAPTVCYGLVGDSLEYGAWKLGRRQEGVAASMLSFGVKFATAVSSVGVLLITLAGYDGTQLMQTDAAKTGINVVVNLLPFVLGTLSILPMIGYKLTPKKVTEIREDLEAGKTKDNQ